MMMPDPTWTNWLILFGIVVLIFIVGTLIEDDAPKWLMAIIGVLVVAGCILLILGIIVIASADDNRHQAAEQRAAKRCDPYAVKNGAWTNDDRYVFSCGSDNRIRTEPLRGE